MYRALILRVFVLVLCVGLAACTWEVVDQEKTRVLNPQLAKAMKKQDTVKVKRLLYSGADVDVVTEPAMETPLHYAVAKNDIELVRFLLKKGASVHAKRVDGVQPIHLVQSEAITLLLLDKGADINAQADDLSTPLHYSGWSSVTASSMVGFLIKHGADVNLQDKHKRTPLHCAMHSRHTEVITQLVKNGTDQNKKDYLGRIPLHTAVRHSSVDYVPLLLEYGADINAKDNRGMTPLGFVIGRYRNIKWALASKNTRDDHFEWALKAYEKLNKDITFLIEKGADENVIIKDRTTLRDIDMLSKAGYTLADVRKAYIKLIEAEIKKKQSKE